MMNAMTRAANGGKQDTGPAKSWRFLTLRLLHTALPAIALLLLSGCGPRITNANIDALNREFDKSEQAEQKGTREPGVSPKEVESILGPPKRMDVRTVERPIKEVKLVRYYYEQDGQTVELHFFDNRLIARVPYLGEKLPDLPLPPEKTTP
jgi:hypothetical protein